MREVIATAAGMAAAFVLGWGVGTEREHARHPDDKVTWPPRYDLDARVDEDDLAEWEAEMEER